MAGLMLQRRRRTLHSAAEDESDILLAVHHRDAGDRFRQRIAGEVDSITAVVRHHLGLSDGDTCAVLSPASWIQGGFNLCVLVDVKIRGSSSTPASRRLVVFRCPLPHKLAEASYPGTLDEKVACEVGTYGWMQEHCPDIRIPHLYAFGFSDGSQVCLPEPLGLMLAQLLG